MDRSNWWDLHSSLAGEPPIVQAIEAGKRAESILFAFASGYQAAIRALFGETRVATFAVTEAGGAHPRSIACAYADGTLSGVKTFASLAPWAEVAYVLARADSGLVMCRSALPACTPFEAMEIPHGVLTFERTPCALLPGDGYTRYTKPFRTIEDVYVHAAVCGLYGRGEFFAELSGLSEGDPLSADVHLALADLLPRIRAVIDHPLLLVAESVRTKRTEAARARSS